ncbi:ribosome silencing factor [Teichococcus aestuarii]|uniref:ribosome silencing factor n=1 Tax=Teichococcus aestuarii TaxID=568898 RepID=UPI000D69D0FA
MRAGAWCRPANTPPARRPSAAPATTSQGRADSPPDGRIAGPRWGPRPTRRDKARQEAAIARTPKSPDETRRKTGTASRTGSTSRPAAKGATRKPAPAKAADRPARSGTAAAKPARASAAKPTPRGAAAKPAARASAAKPSTRTSAAKPAPRGAAAQPSRDTAPKAATSRTAKPASRTGAAKSTARSATPPARAPRDAAARSAPRTGAAKGATRGAAPAAKAPRAAAPKAATGRTARPATRTGAAKGTTRGAAPAARAPRAAAPKANTARATASKAVTPAKKAEPKAKPAATVKTRKPPKRTKLSPPQIELIVQSAVKSLEDDKAEDVVVLDVASRAAFADRMIVATGLADRQIQAMATHLEKALAEHGIRRIRTETSPDWVLLDAGDLIVHLFKPEARANYRLEKMWGPDSPPAGDAPLAGPEEAPIPSLTEAEWMQDEEEEESGELVDGLGDDDILDADEADEPDEPDDGEARG